MNDHHLENLLSSLRPIPPSQELEQRVQHDLDLIAAFREATPEAVVSQRKPLAGLSNLVWAGLGAAAAVVVMSAFHNVSGAAGSRSVVIQPATPATSAASIMPVSSTREWVDVEDQGISYTASDSPERRVKVRSMERHQWIDPRDGAEYTVEVPQEESVIVPVKFQ